MREEFHRSNEAQEAKRGHNAGTKNHILLSAIIPNYNHGMVIEKAVSALAAQTPAPDEIIIVDDASTDGSPSVLERLCAQYPTIRSVLLGKREGALSALNKGLKEARGTYVYFGAADDLTRPGFFHTMLGELARSPRAAFACGEAILIEIDTGRRGYRPPVRPTYVASFLSADAVARTFRRIDNWILTGAAVLRRDLIVEEGGFDSALGPFADSYALRRLALMHGCCFVPYVGVVWQVSARGLSRTLAADSDATLKLLEAALERMRADPVFPAWYPAVFERRWRFAVARLAAEARPIDRTVLTRIGARGAFGRAILNSAAALGGVLGRITALIWLTVRERPTSLSGLVATKLSRFLGR